MDKKVTKFNTSACNVDNCYRSTVSHQFGKGWCPLHAQEKHEELDTLSFCDPADYIK